MSTTFRAVLAVIMLAGFYVVAGALIVVLGLLSMLAFQNDAGTAGAKIAFVALIAAAGIVVGLWQVAKARPEPQPGVVLSPEDAPELWALVTELAQEAQTQGPSEIRLVPEVNAAVSEDARLLGLMSGPRRLYLGVPLLMGLDVAQVRSVLGHELGHYSRSHTRLAPVVYRGQVAISATIEQLSRNIVGWFLRGYAMLHFLVSAAVTRRQELEADELSVRIAGREVAQSALRELPVIDATWSFYESAYIGPAWENGMAPAADRFFSGFGHLLHGRAAELDQMRSDAPPSEESRWDTHPSIAARITAMDRMADHPVERDARPATVLIPHFDTVATELAELVVSFDDRTRMDWAELTAAAVAASEQRSADTAYRAVARLAGQSRATLGTLLDLVAAGRGSELERDLGLVATSPEGQSSDGDSAADHQPTQALVGDTHEHAHEDTHADATLVDVLESVLGAAVVAAGSGRWQHSWSGPASLVTNDDTPVPLTKIAELAADPETVAQARERLAALGVDTDALGQVEDRATAHGSEILGALATIKVDGSEHDVIVLDRGLILVPCPKKTEGGKTRLMELVSSASVVDLAAQHRFVAFEDVATGTVHKPVPARLDLTLHDGQTLTFKEGWTGESLTKDSSATFVAIVEDLAKQNA